jgi:chemotaxis protein histidine kinase CheA
MTSGKRPADRTEVLALFAEEAAGHLAGLRTGLARLRSSTSSPAPPLDALRRDAHGIVGSAWAVGLHPAAVLMQAVEQACVDMIRAGATPSASFVDAVARAVDAADTLVAAAVADDPTSPSVDVDALVVAMDAAVER